jgi:hypothetical protein
MSLSLAEIVENLRAIREDPRSEIEWDALLRTHGVPRVTYRGRRLEWPRRCVSVVGGALDQVQVEAVAEQVLGVCLRDVLRRDGRPELEVHERSIAAAERLGPAFVDRIETAVSFVIEEHELRAALNVH